MELLKKISQAAELIIPVALVFVMFAVSAYIVHILVSLHFKGLT